MRRKEYETELRLHGELVAMQEWVKATGAKIAWSSRADTAGKGGIIKPITERAAPAYLGGAAGPTEREKSQM